MNVLFYLEPHFEFSEPNHKLNFLVDWLPPRIAALREAFGPSLKVMVLTSDNLARQGELEPFVDVVAYGQNELYDLWRDNPLDLRTEWFKDKPDEALSRRQGEALKARMGRFEPDLIISLTSANFFKHVFPGAALLHHEFGLMSRRPLPETWFFDPLGPGGTRSIDRFWPSERGRWTEEGDLGPALELMRTYRDAIEHGNPWGADIARLAEPWRRRALFPMQETGHALFDGHTAVPNALQYALAVLEEVPRDVGVFITDHPGRPGLSASAKSYIAWKYPNALFVPDSFGDAAPSQYFLPSVDFVYSMSTTVGALTTFWGNRLIGLSPLYLDSIVHGATLEAAAAAQPASERERAGFLRFLVNRILATADQIADPVWMGAMARNAVTAHRDGRPTLIYPPLASEARTFADWTAIVDRASRRQRLHAPIRRFLADVDSGALSSAAQHLELVKGAADDPGGSDLGEALEIRLNYYLGMYALNGEGDSVVAEARFARSHAQAADLLQKGVGDLAEARNFYWWGGFHAVLSVRRQERFEESRIQAKRLVEAFAPAAAPMPDGLAERVEAELLA
jgi:hypothetical protein